MMMFDGHQKKKYERIEIPYICVNLCYKGTKQTNERKHYILLANELN